MTNEGQTFLSGSTGWAVQPINRNNRLTGRDDGKIASPGLNVNSKMEKILKMLDEGAGRGNHPTGFSNREDDKERRQGKDDRRSAGKARLSKRSGKGKAR